MKLIVGLGNPGQQYAGTRHNIGSSILLAYADQQGITFQDKPKFHAVVTEYGHGDEKILLAIPTTYYNESGSAVRDIAAFYKIDLSDILIVHDELALPFGTIRTRIGGSDAGNNGVKSVSSHVGQDTSRLRFGVYNELRDKVDDADFVLDKFTKDEQLQIEKLLPSTFDIINSFVAGTFDTTTHKSQYNLDATFLH